MKQPLTPETEKALASLVAAMGATEFHISQPYICDNCQNPDKEAFPYGVKDREGKHWDDLCNDCFDLLGCSYPEATQTLSDEVIYDLLRQLPISTTDDHGQGIKNVHNGLSLKDLVVDWIYDQLRQPDAPEVNYDDPDFAELLGYLDANIPSYVEALCIVVTNWDSLVGDSEPTAYQQQAGPEWVRPERGES